MTVIAYPHGTFSWVDLSTTDGEAAKAFYTGLFDWTFLDNPLPMGGVYTMYQQDGKNVAASSQMSAEQATYMPPLWNSYITVEDVEATTARVADLGGSVVAPAFDVMDAGRMSVIADPTGAVVSLWQTRGHRGAELFNLPNSLAWNELMTNDTAAAEAFYTALLGWGAATDANGYTAFTVGKRVNGGMMAIMAEMGPIPPHWMAYFAVADINATATKAAELGATILAGPFPAGEVGHICVIQDPQGARFSAIQMAAADADLPGES